MILPPERLSALIGAIYDCVIRPDQWPATLESLRASANGANALLAANRLPSGALLISAVVGMPPEWLARIDDYGEQVVEVWGGVQRIAQYPLEEPVVCSQAMGMPHMERNRFYQEWARPQGIFDSMSMPLVRDDTLIGTLTMGRHEDAGPFTDDELDLLRLVAPHLRRAVTISHLLDREVLTAATLAATLDALTVAVVIVDDTLKILHANRRAEELARARTSIVFDQGRLRLPSPAAMGALHRATSIAARGEAGLDGRSIRVPVSRGDAAVVAHVLPLAGHSTRGGLLPKATAAVFLAPAVSPPSLPGDALAALYGLTPAEARVLELVAGGHTQPEIARMLGIAASTVKTHLLRVFDKTGRHRQADLVKLTASLTLPV